MINLFKSNWSKWQVLGNYQHSTDDYIVFAKINKKTGMMKFKTLKVQSGYSNHIFNFRFDVKENWEKITGELK